MMINEILVAQREYFRSGIAARREVRTRALHDVERWVKANAERIARALAEDFAKPGFESFATESGLIIDEARLLRKKLPRLMRVRRATSPLAHFSSRSWIQPEPFGTVLIISPWNYPFQLAMAPLVGALAAGNTVVLKPSELAPATAELLKLMQQELFDPAQVAVITGGRETSERLLAERFDSIFFTGSTAVGRIVMESAAKHLTPVTLELGGKSPCIVAADADLELAARRIVWGKFLNAGQTCVAPDYVYAHASVAPRLVERLVNCIREFYGNEPRDSADYARMISVRHAERLAAFFREGTPACGGTADAAARYVAPTVLTGVSWDSPVMSEEIFGPVLPVLTWDTEAEAWHRLYSRETPLAQYLFTRSRATERFFMNGLRFGGGCVNDTVIHVANPHLPFGGIGASGMGSYHGVKSFETFTHYKSIMKKTSLFDVPLRYPPYTATKLSWVKRFIG